MRKIIVMFVLICTVCALAATAEQLKDETWNHLQTVEAKQRNLKTKVYAGTWDQVQAQRVSDVNEVCTDIAKAQATAYELMTLTGTDQTIRDAIQSVICEKTCNKAVSQKKTNGQFLQAVEVYMTDPNNIPEPNDIAEAARLENFREVCLQVVDVMGGI